MIEDGQIVLVINYFWLAGCAVVFWFMFGIFSTYRFIQVSGAPSIATSAERPLNIWIARFFIVLIVLTMIIFWPGLYAVLIGYMLT